MTELAAVVGVPVAVVTDVIAALTARRLTVATAESLTGGLLVAVLTEIPGSSAVVRGGLVVYATELKHQLADVDADLLAARGPVDPQVAAALADGARHRCGASIGVGLTGVAGPDPQDGVPVGTWFCAVSGPLDHRDDRRGRPQPTVPLTESDRNATSDAARRGRIRAAAVRGALDLLANIAATHS
jgi:nicotinamide-nucleotide amidase